jgi:hypothetical protein
MGWGHLKIFSRSIGPNFTRLGTNPPWGEEIQVSSNEGDCLLQGEIIAKQYKYTEFFFKKKKASSPEPAGQIQSNLVQIIPG